MSTEPNNLWVMTEFVGIEDVGEEEEKRYRFGGDDHPIESWTDKPGDLYRDCLKEYGRCIGKAYIDTADGALAVGWVFLSREQYEDCKDTYLRETWVTVCEAPDTVTRERHYAKIG